MRRSLYAAALAALLVVPAASAPAQQQPVARFEPAARVVESRPSDPDALRALRTRAADSAARYSSVARRQRLLQRSLFVGGAALVAGSYARWLGGDTRRGMTAGGAGLLGAGLASTAYGVNRRDAAERARTASARWTRVAAGDVP